MRLHNGGSTITSEMIQHDRCQDLVPKHVKLSDSAIAVLVMLSISQSVMTNSYALDITAQGQIIKRPQRNSIGHGVAYDNHLLRWHGHLLQGEHPGLEMEVYDIDRSSGSKRSALRNIELHTHFPNTALFHDTRVRLTREASLTPKPPSIDKTGHPMQDHGSLSGGAHRRSFSDPEQAEARKRTKYDQPKESERATARPRPSPLHFSLPDPLSIPDTLHHSNRSPSAPFETPKQSLLPTSP